MQYRLKEKVRLHPPQNESAEKNYVSATKNEQKRAKKSHKYIWNNAPAL